MKYKYILVFAIIVKVFNALEVNDQVNSSELNSKELHDDYEMDSTDQSSDQCSADEVIAKILDILTPEDLEEGKENIKSDIESFNETIEAVLRLQQYARNVSQKMSEFSKRLNSRLSETLMTINLPSDCLTSLIRIMTAAKNGELWAIKCELQNVRSHNKMQSTMFI